MHPEPVQGDANLVLRTVLKVNFGAGQSFRFVGQQASVFCVDKSASFRECESLLDCDWCAEDSNCVNPDINEPDHECPRGTVRVFPPECVVSSSLQWSSFCQHELLTILNDSCEPNRNTRACQPQRCPSSSQPTLFNFPSHPNTLFIWQIQKTMLPVLSIYLLPFLSPPFKFQ